MRLNKFILAAIICICPPLFGMQSKTVKDGDVIEIEISEKALTRVHCTQGVRVDKVWGKTSGIVIHTDAEKGEFSIEVKEKPKTPISFFIRDSNDGVYTVHAKIVDKLTSTVQLNTQKKVAKKAELPKKSDNFKKRLKSIMKTLALADQSRGEWRDADGEPVKLWRDIDIKMMQDADFGGLIGEIYHIQNNTNKEQTFTEPEFMVIGAGVHAIALSKATLAPGDRGYLYIIRSDKGGQDE